MIPLPLPPRPEDVGGYAPHPLFVPNLVLHLLLGWHSAAQILSYLAQL
jgi:hypothetical protein